MAGRPPLEGQAQAEVGHLGTVARGLGPQLGGPERRPVVVEQPQAALQGPLGPTLVAEGAKGEGLAVPGPGSHQGRAPPARQPDGDELVGHAT